MNCDYIMPELILLLYLESSCYNFEAFTTPPYSLLWLRCPLHATTPYSLLCTHCRCAKKKWTVIISCQSLYYCFTLKARAIILRRLLRRHTHYYDCVVRCMLRHHTHYYALIVGVLRRNELWLYLAWKPSRAFEGDVSYYLPGALLLFDLRCMLRIWFPQICVFVHFDL